MRAGIEALVSAAGPMTTPELASGSRLVIPTSPTPFVPPQLLVPGDDPPETALGVEVIIISSAAAVGKSTVAKYLSATAGLPLLDLSKVHVSTNSLVGLIATDIASPTNPASALQQGEFGLIVDALDEGRLLSGDANFEEFLRTSWELLLRERSAIDRPKIILLGREFAAELVNTTLDLYGEGLTVAALTLDFFDEAGAIAVVEAHAAATPMRNGTEWRSSGPAREAIASFFDAIAEALGLDAASLWMDNQGRAFAGYAPVLAAIGTLLASEPNPARLRSALESAGAGRAWEVIERVADAILERERNEKVIPQLERSVSMPPSAQAYDVFEQLTYLTNVVQGQPVRATSRVALSGSDGETYQRMLDQHVPEHPFLQQGVLANEVLASIVLAHAIVNDRITGDGVDILRDASRLPFLWRSCRRLLEDSPTLIDGRYAGFILNSLWSDTLVGQLRVEAHATPAQQDVATIDVHVDDGVWSFEALHPIELYEQLGECDIRVEGDVVMQGHAGRQGSPSFDVRGDVTLITHATLDLRASAVRLDGSVRIAAGAVAQPANLQIATTERTRVWFGGRIRDAYPWSQHQSSLDAPVEAEPATPFETILVLCAERLPAGAPLTLNRGYLPEGDVRFGWISREIRPEEFSNLIGLLVEYGLATTQGAPASGSIAMVRVHFSATWDRLLQALRTPQLVDDELAATVATVRDAFHARSTR